MRLFRPLTSHLGLVAILVIASLVYVVGVFSLVSPPPSMSPPLGPSPSTSPSTPKPDPTPTPSTSPIPTPIPSLLPTSTPTLLSAPILLQVPKVDMSHNLDCEAAAMAAILQYHDVSITQNQILSLLPVDTTPATLQSGQLVSWGDPNTAFVGNVDGEDNAKTVPPTGYGVYYQPLVKVAEEEGQPSEGGDGWTWDQLLTQLQSGNPVLVRVPYHLEQWNTPSWDPSGKVIWITAADGSRVWIYPSDHAQVLIGYNPTTSVITLMDPYGGAYETYPLATFLSWWQVEQNEAVAVQ